MFQLYSPLISGDFKNKCTGMGENPHLFGLFLHEVIYGIRKYLCFLGKANRDNI